MDLPLVHVLMCTFNGEPYLREQLDSIFCQQGVNIKLYVNDDGSTDSTLEILNEYRRNHDVKISFSERIGSTKGFLRLIQECDTADYFSFSDQDDIWKDNKLITLISQIEDENFPTLVFSNRNYIGGSGGVVGNSKTKSSACYFKYALWENLAPGNTQLINKPGRRLLLAGLPPGEILYFDSWLFLLFSLVGNVKFVDTRLVNYRLHAKNQVGIKTKAQGLRSIFTKIKVQQQQNSMMEKVSVVWSSKNFSLLVSEVEVLDSGNLMEFLHKLQNSCADFQSSLKRIIFKISKLFFYISHKKSLF
jgi:rhamnosyltransferase